MHGTFHTYIYSVKYVNIIHLMTHAWLMSCMYIYMYVCVYVSIHACICMYVYANTYAYNVCLYVCSMYACKCYIQVYIHVCMYVTYPSMLSNQLEALNSDQADLVVGADNSTYLSF